MKHRHNEIEWMWIDGEKKDDELTLVLWPWYSSDRWVE